MKYSFFSALCAATLVFALPLGVYADTSTTVAPIPTTTTTSSCDITISDFTALQVIQQNKSLSYANELQQELSVRKRILTKTIQCAQNDALQLQIELNNTTIDPGLESIKVQLSDNLNSAVSYYNLQTQNVSWAGISGTKSIAGNILSWRENNYAPLAENVTNFIAWANNQSLFSAAETRLSQINNLITSPLFSENISIQRDYQEAVVSLKAAEDQNGDAKNAFAQSLSPQQTLSYIQQSLSLLSNTYQHFFNISSLIQSLIPN